MHTVLTAMMTCTLVLTNISILCITSGQRILTEGRIACCMSLLTMKWYLLLHTLQQLLQMLWKVTKILQTSPVKSSRMDTIPTLLLRACSDTFSEIITNLANLFFSEGRFPTQFKSASVTPLLTKLHHQATDRYLTWILSQTSWTPIP